jgi:hypothetical protein
VIKDLIPGRGKRDFSPPEHPEQLCGLPSHLFNEYYGIFPHG